MIHLNSCLYELKDENTWKNWKQTLNSPEIPGSFSKKFKDTYNIDIKDNFNQNTSSEIGYNTKMDVNEEVLVDLESDKILEK